MRKRGSKNLGREGFTLIEVLLVTFLLFLLAYATFSSVRATMATKEDIDGTTEVLQSNRSLLALIERDVNGAYYVMAVDLGWNPPTTQTTNVRVNAVPTPQPTVPEPATIFQGRSDELLMSTRTHQRMNADAPENEQTYVRYRIEQKKLIREESYRVISKEDLSDAKQYVEFTVVDGVERLEFKYWDPARADWTESWDTNGAETLDVLPSAVSVHIIYQPERSVVDEKNDKPVDLRSVFLVTQRLLKEGAFKK
jgi:type II secretory pathway component PulJ